MEPADAGSKLAGKVFHDALFQKPKVGVTLICSQKVSYGVEDVRSSVENYMKFAHQQDEPFPSRCGEYALHEEDTAEYAGQ